jgi:hypothetical protein
LSLRALTMERLQPHSLTQAQALSQGVSPRLSRPLEPTLQLLSSMTRRTRLLLNNTLALHLSSDLQPSLGHSLLVLSQAPSSFSIPSQLTPSRTLVPAVSLALSHTPSMTRLEDHQAPSSLRLLSSLLPRCHTPGRARSQAPSPRLLQLLVSFQVLSLSKFP